jgi:hypothetical protein
MPEPRKPNRDLSKSNKRLSPHDELLRLGYRSYLRDLPVLLRRNLEGHQVAYFGGTQIAIADTDDKLWDEVSKNPIYADRMADVHFQRITYLDALEKNISIISK